MRGRKVGLACWNGVSELINEASIGLVILFINWILLARIGSYGVAAFTIINYAAWFGASVSYAISDFPVPVGKRQFRGPELRPRPPVPWAGLEYGLRHRLMLYGVFACTRKCC